MIQTQKRFSKNGQNYIEDLNGYIIGFVWIDNDNIQRRTLYTNSVDDLEACRTSAGFRYEMLDPETNEWILRKGDNAFATMDSFVNMQGELQIEPYEDDITKPILDPNDGVTVIGYEQKIKDGLIPEFDFFYNLQLQLFNGVMRAIQARKFGATGFN